MPDVLDGRGRQPNSHGCFICGLANPIGLKIVFHEDRERMQVRARLTVAEGYRSYPGVVHGGIVATILDETAGRALIVHSQDINDFFVTAKMEVRYRRATPTDTPLLAVGWVEHYGERARVRGELRLVESKPGEPTTLLAECSSLVVRAQAGFLDSWDQEVPHWRVYSDSELAEAGCGLLNELGFRRAQLHNAACAVGVVRLTGDPPCLYNASRRQYAFVRPTCGA